MSSQSGGWRTDGSAAGPQPRQAGRQEEKRGRDIGEGEAGCSEQIKQGAGSLSTHVFHLVERTLSAKQGRREADVYPGGGVMGHFLFNVTAPNKAVSIPSVLYYIKVF